MSEQQVPETTLDQIREADQKTLIQFYEWLDREVASGHIWWIPTKWMVGLQVTAMKRGGNKAENKKG